MKIRLLSFLILSVLGLPARAGAQQVMDRVVATVNGSPILQSECDSQARYEAFVEQKVPEHAQQAALQRVMDQELLRQQIRNGEAAPADREVAEKIREIRGQIPGASTEEGWRRALAAYGLTADELRERVAAQLELMRFVDRRLRPSVRISSKEVETYYRETFLPELRKRGAGEEPLAEVSERIEEVLAQREMDQEMTTWLEELRRQSTIRLLRPVAAEEKAATR